MVLIFAPAALLTAAGDSAVGEAIVWAAAAFGQFFAVSVWNGVLVFLLIGAVSFLLSWLLVRRAVIRSVK